MIRRLHEADDQACQQLLAKRPAENLFIIGDIENFGYEQDFQKLWGEFDDNQQLIAILLKYHNNYICYAEGEFDAPAFAEIINEDTDFMQLSGLQSITSQILSHIQHPAPKTRTLYYAKCETTAYLDQKADTKNVQRAKLGDIPSITMLHSLIPEFEMDNSREDSMKRGLQNGSARTYFIKNDREVLSCASTTAENSMSAMVVGVCTHPDYKKQGYASICMTKLCHELLAEGKMLCLFYDNPEAGSIYKRLGFEDIGKWMMHVFHPVEQVS
ncbi:GNAT family N-acetyltransferase [Halobacillus sp. B29]|uniref:GNAT family N-acetyltransferase n=1 Tax=Halobacillus sp. B29 TaxID=3457432 RepID=UPI003FCCAFFE